MSDYCGCCATNTEHIRQHYDPDDITRPTALPADVLASFQACRYPGEPPCPLTLEDIEDYLVALKEQV